MTHRNTVSDPRWLLLLRSQEFAFSRAQAMQFGITDSMIRAQIDAGRWQRVYSSTFVAHNASRSFSCQLWAALLFVGPPALASRRTSGYVAGLFDDCPETIELDVPAWRRPRGAPGIVIRRRRGALVAVGWPPRTSVEETVLDLIAKSTRADDVVGLITRACQRRLTTVKRLTEAVVARPRMPWRALILDVLDDARGAQSPLEWRYLRFVERAHGLPSGDRQVGALSGSSRLWRDVVYSAYGVVVELDGAAAHPGIRRHRDMARDNDVTASGRKSLRYGWHDVAGRPCAVAEQVAVVLRLAGWAGVLRLCGPKCSVRGQSRSLGR
jgi:hypothetical protein